MMKWMKVTVFAVVCALSAGACVSPEGEDEAVRVLESPELSVELAPEECTQTETLPDGTVVERCCMEGEAGCPETGQTWWYICSTKIAQLARCAAACGHECPRVETNSCVY